MTVSRCLGYLFPSRFHPPALEQQYAAHRTADVRLRCLLHALSYTLVMVLMVISFSVLWDSETLFAVTYRVQVAAVGAAALLYAVMFAAHKQDGAASKLLCKYNDAAQTIPVVYICMLAPVIEPYRLMKLLGSTYADEIGKWAVRMIELGEDLGTKETCGGWVEGDLQHGGQHACIFTSYEALVMAVIIYVVASAAIFGRTSPPVLTAVECSHRVPQPCCTYGVRVPASCVSRVPAAQGSLPPRRATVRRRTRTSLGRAVVPSYR